MLSLSWHGRDLQINYMRLSKRGLFGLLLTVLLSSCVTVTVLIDDIAERHRYLTMQTLQTLLHDKKFTYAYIIAHSMREEELFSLQEIQPIIDSALKSMQDNFAKALETGNIPELERLFESLTAIGESPEITRKELILIKRREYSRQDNIVLLIQSLVNKGFLEAHDSAELMQYAEYAQQHLQRDLLTNIIGILDEREADYPDNLRNIVTPTPKDMLQGTVTIWVNKGSLIEKGIQYDDGALGTGFFIDYRGHIITNYHVVASEVDPDYEGYSRLYIRTSDAPTQLIPAKVLSYDRVLDLALLKTEVTPELVFPVSSTVQADIGDAAIALGSPIGLYNTVTSGIVSALERDIIPLGSAFQFDALVYPGNSGGPLINPSGELLGVVFAGVGTMEGLNFAIPAQWLSRVLACLYREEKVRHSWLGVALVNDMDAGSNNSVRVMYVIPTSTAAYAGVMQNDVLVAVNDMEISSLIEGQEILAQYQPGSIVKTRWQRDGVERDLYLMTEERPYSPIETALEHYPLDYLMPPLFGIQTETLKRTRKRTRLAIVEVYPGSYAEFMDYLPGDEITIIDWTINHETRSVQVLMFSRQRRDAFLERRRQFVLHLDRNSFL